MHMFPVFAVQFLAPVLIGSIRHLNEKTHRCYFTDYKVRSKPSCYRAFTNVCGHKIDIDVLHYFVE